MADKQPEILWETLELSAKPSPAGRDILVIYRVKARKKNWSEYAEYRVQFKLNKSRDLLFQEVELLVAEADQATWHGSVRPDLVAAIRDHFLRTQHYSDVARQLGWSPQAAPTAP